MCAPWRADTQVRPYILLAALYLKLARCNFQHLGL
jgi:hypothetical protein